MLPLSTCWLFLLDKHVLNEDEKKTQESVRLQFFYKFYIYTIRHYKSSFDEKILIIVLLDGFIYGFVSSLRINSLLFVQVRQTGVKICSVRDNPSAGRIFRILSALWNTSWLVQFRFIHAHQFRLYVWFCKSTAIAVIRLQNCLLMCSLY